MVDWTRVEELRSEIGEDDFDEVVALFLQETDEVVDRLSTDPQVAHLEQLLHSLKGSSVNLGLATLSTLCADGERQAASGHPERVDLDAIGKVYARSKDEFLAGLRQRPAA
jgi:HPt (histidine-containing phosphotransfer) domain-containing protein